MIDPALANDEPSKLSFADGLSAGFLIGVLVMLALETWVGHVPVSP